MPRVCSFQGCKNSTEDKTLRFFNFRKHDYEKWAEACGLSLENMMMKSILTNKVVCSEHFSSEDFEMKFQFSPFKKQAKLLTTALPKGNTNLYFTFYLITLDYMYLKL